MTDSNDNFDENINPDSNYHLFTQNTNSICRYMSINEYNASLNFNNYFSILSYNIRSFDKNFDSFSCGLSPQSMPDILCLSETWFSRNITSEIPGYSGYHVTRDGRSGGISLFTKKKFDSRFLRDLSYSSPTIEVCTVEISIQQSVFVIIGIYRPHSDSINNFNFHLDSFLNNSLLRNKTCILLGDLNICLLKDDPAILEYSNLLYSHNYFCPINKPTHFSSVDGVAPTLLDHIFINKFFSYNCGIIDLDLTDHLPVYINLKFENISDNSKIKIKFRLIDDESKSVFKAALENFNWTSIVHENANIYAEAFLSKLDEVYRGSFPVKTKIISNKYVCNPWANSDHCKLIKAKSDYFFLHRLNLISKQENNQFKNKINRLIKKDKRNYYQNLFARNRYDMKKTWKVINSLISKNQNHNVIKKILLHNIEFTSEEEIANVFNNYFCSIGSELDAQIPLSNLDPLHYINFNAERSFFLNPVSNLEVEFHIKNLKNSKQNMESISISILKDNVRFISTVLADLINLCFISGKFPNVLKRAVVIPLFKKGDATSVANYRPISLLPWLSKVTEKCMKTRLLDYLYHYKIINPFQFGFQLGISTQDAVMHITEKLYANLNNKLSSIGIFIDFSKCFDTINIPILLRKIESYGIRGVPLQLITCYLTGRSQIVKIGKSFSDSKATEIGVPQGSVLAPILFLLYVNEIPNIFADFNACLFADDTTFLVSDHDTQSLFNTCEIGLGKFADWCSANRLSLNVSKTNYMLFSNLSLPSNLPLLSINNTSIERASSVRFLGVELDDKLKFQIHINNISCKISKIAGILSKLAYFVPQEVLITLYHSLIEPYLNYCPLIFGGSYSSHILPLEVAQRKSVRIISKVDRLAHSNPLFANLGILKLIDLYKFHLGIYTYKNFETIDASIPNHSHDTRYNFLNPVFQRLTLTQRQSVAYQAPNNWNSIPLDIKNSVSLASFKRSYKKYLLSLY